MDSISLTPLNHYSSIFHNPITKNIPQIHFNRIYSPLRFRPQFSRRIVPTFPQDGDNNLANPFPQNWAQSRPGILIGKYYRDNFDVDEEEDEDDDEDEEDRSLGLFVKFLENVFKKISRKARKDVRSVLPVNVSAKLVRFSVNGVLILTFLWVLKAFLEVVCTLGSVVFISILVIRGVWAGISQLQENRYYKRDGIDDFSWSGTRPAS